jgi:glycosyltransferase involved in cell wall biosynthesis
VFRTVYPNKVFDYMSAGRPILLAIDGVARELVEQAGAGVFVPPEDPVAFARALRQLASDPELCRELGRSGLDYVTSRYSREVLSDRYLEILERRVAAGGSRMAAG